MFATLDLPLRDDNRHKRLKVGRACHPCRMKKIKCDGKQPCMQCKARRRKCMYLKNTDATYIKLDPDEPLALELTNTNNNNKINDDDVGVDVSETMEAITMDNEPLFQTNPQQHSSRYQNGSNRSTAILTRTDKMMEQLTDGLVQLTLHQDTSTLKQAIVTPWRNYGDFIRWSGEPALPTDYSATLEMPLRSIQEQLIQVFFTHCQPYMLPTLSKGMLYDQLHTKGSLVTPLLLNMIYAHASAYQHQQQQPPPPLGIPPSTLFSSASTSSSRSTSPFHSFSSSTSSSTASLSSPSTSASSPSSEADIFYQRARHLLDDFMDTPRISTVIALIYMVSFENNIQQQQRTGRSSRAWMYSGMAIRMCLELGLHTSHYSSQMSQFDIELRKRVLWTCYVMDKVESCTMERPCMLRSQDITLDLPTPLPEDDQQERNVLDGFAPLCRLMMLVEKVLIFFTYGATTQDDEEGNTSGGDWSTTKEAQVLYFLEKLVQWRERLPEELQWQPHRSSSLDLFGAGSMAAMRPSSAIAANLHLLSYDLELSLVLCCRFQMDPMQCDRRRAVANTITHLVTLMVQHPYLMYTPSFSLSGFSGIFAALAHAMDVDHPTRADVAKDAKLQFKLTLEMIRGLVERIPMRDVQHFIGLIDNFLQPTSSTAPPFLFVSAMNNLTHLGQTPVSTSVNNGNSSDKDTLAPSASSSMTDQGKIMQRMFGTNDLYEAQMIAKTLSTMQHHHHHHHPSFPTPFTTPSPPPIHPRHQQHDGSIARLEDHHLHQKQQQRSYPVTAASSSVTSPSSSPPPPSVTTNSVMPGMPCYDFASSQAAAAAAAAVGAVGPPLTNHHQQSVLPMTTATPTATTPASSSMIMPAMTIPTGPAQAKNIEPADYTFELISVDDEWAKSLIY